MNGVFGMTNWIGGLVAMLTSYFRPISQTFLDKTGNYTLTAADNGKHLTNAGAAGAVNFTLPAAQKGLSFPVTVMAAQTLRVVSAGAAGTMRATGSSNGIQAVSSTILANLEVACLDGTNWVLRAVAGAWAIT